MSAAIIAASRGAALVVALAVAACTTRDAEGVRRADSATAADDSIAQARPAGEPLSDASPAEAAKQAGATPATASGGKVDYFTAAQLDQVAAALSHGTTTGHTLGAHGTYQYLQIRRVDNGVPEIHDRWIDVTMVQAGRASLLSGGRVSGGADQGGGEHRGGSIAGGTRRPVGPGDLMVIPAGVPHQYEIARGDSLRYVTVKVLSTPPASGSP